MKLIIQIPAYNEESTLTQTLADLPKRLPGIQSIETLVIDDGSTDGTVAAARRGGATHVVRLLTHRGLSPAFVAGIDACLRLGADVIVNTDADNQYQGADIGKIVAPILSGSAEVVIGDRDVRSSEHMGPLKRFLQAFGSWAVGRAAGTTIPDATSGLRAFSREAAFQINVFNPFTYTLETIIQAGNRNLGVSSVQVRTNPPTRPSRLYHGMFNYVRKSVVTIFRIYTLYKPLKTFFFLGSLMVFCGLILGVRFLVFYFSGDGGGHLQSLILTSVFLILGVQTFLIGLVADLISVNRRLSEETLIRLKKLDPTSQIGASKGRPPHREQHRNDRPAPKQRQSLASLPPKAEPESETAQTQWVWLMDEAKLEGRAEPKDKPATPTAQQQQQNPEGKRRRRRRRGFPDARGSREPILHPHPKEQREGTPAKGPDDAERPVDG